MRVIVIHANHIHRVHHPVEVVPVLVHHHVVNKLRRVLKVVPAPVGNRIDAHDDGIRALPADDRGGIAEHADRNIRGLFQGAGRQQQSGRPVASEVADIQVAIRFVLGDIDLHIRSEGADDFCDIDIPGGFHAGVEEVRPGLVLRVIEPVRKGEVPERDDRFDPGGAKGLCHTHVLADRHFVEDSRFRFDAPPLDTETIMVHSHFFQSRNILVEAGPGEGRIVPPWRNVAFAGKNVPVGLKIGRRAARNSAVLVLKARRRSAPPKFSRDRRVSSGCGSHVGSGGHHAAGKKEKEEAGQ